MREKILWCIFILCMRDFGDASEFHYPPPKEQEHWGGMCDSGTKQSPIDLDPDVALVGHFTRLTLMNYDRDVKTNITNTGHSMQVAFGPEYGMKMTAGGLGGLYVLDQMHFHWGSEHTVDGKRYALELHLVHHEERFSGIAEAAKVRNGLAVLGVLFHLSEDSNPTLDLILNSAEEIMKAPHEVVACEEPVNPFRLLPRDTDRFYRYDGSLTTPGCNEAVVWTVFEQSLPMSVLQLQRFKQMQSSDGTPLRHNYRPVKQLGDRVLIYHTAESSVSGVTAPISGAKALTTIGVLLALFSTKM